MRKPKHHQHINKLTFYTDGKKAPGLRFQGEMMICAICGKQQQSDPAVESDWRYIQYDGKGGYVCPDHFPPGETGTKEQFQEAYKAAILTIIGIKP